MARYTLKIKSRFWFILMALMLIVSAIVTAEQNQTIAVQSARIAEMTATKENMEIDIASAERKLEFCKSDDYIERIARSQLGLVMPDEVLYVNANDPS